MQQNTEPLKAAEDYFNKVNKIMKYIGIQHNYNFKSGFFLNINLDGIITIN